MMSGVQFLMVAGTLVALKAWAQETCTPAADVEVTIPSYSPLEPFVTGMMPGSKHPRFILAGDTNWPPYSYLATPPEGDLVVAGIGAEIAMGLEDVCDIEVTVIEAKWAECWDAGHIGASLKHGDYSGCLTYTHTYGERNRYLEFSDPILNDKMPAGILTRIVNGIPHVSGGSNLNGQTVIDVSGWAPTADTLALQVNTCTGSKFEGFTVVPSASDDDNNDANDDALKKLLSGTADVMWVYANQVENRMCDNAGKDMNGNTATWDCSLWNQFGTNFAYTHVGLYGHAIAGTTLSVSKKGTGASTVLNPCIQKFLQTKKYYDICVKHNVVHDCFRNSYFPPLTSNPPVWAHQTNQVTTDCSTGYCKCS